MSYRVNLMVAAAAAGLSLAAAANATTIGINFSGGGSGGGPNNVTGTAGAVAQTNWNNVAGIGNTTNNLVDSSGAPTGVSVTTAGGNTWSNGAPNDGGNGSLMSNFLDGGSGGQDTVTIPLSSSFNAASYSVYVYMESNQTSTSDFTINGTTYYALNETDNSAALNQITPSVTPANAQQGNYFVVNGLTGTLTIVANKNSIGDFRSSVDGIQLVGTNLTPEPASLGLLGLMSLGLLARRNRTA